MEAILQNLQEQEIQLQQTQNLYTHDLGNMENLNNEKPPLPPPRKYVSIFRIDGEPILPPLMTIEKRKEIQKLREKALQIEQSLRKRKQKANRENGIEVNQNNECEYSNSLLFHREGNKSQRSQDSYEAKLKESEESMVLLKGLIQTQMETEEKLKKTVCNSSANSNGDINQEKIQKLQKSEILIYDNSTNEVIQVSAEKGNRSAEDEPRLLRKVETNCNLIPNKKPTHLLLAGASFKGTSAIPSICLNPPTPLAVNKSLCETLSGADSSGSSVVSENLSKSLESGQEISSDESFNSMITQSDRKPNRNTYHNIVKSKKLLTHTKNVSAKIQQFEAISSENNTPETSPEKVYNNRKMYLGTSSSTLSRSATSPSIKLSTSNRSPSSRSQSLAQDSPENSLVRSSSFTLEGPSKALIEHMQQQKVVSESKTAVKSPLNTTRNLSRKLVSSPLRAYRDTVESKAKKVQKVELKSSRQKIQQKPLQSKLTQAAAASLSPYNSNSLCKLKRSSCEISKVTHASPQTLQKTSAVKMRNSSSTSSNFTQTKTSKAKLTSSTSTSTFTSTLINAGKTTPTGNKPFNEMAKAQKDKFMKLLAQQEEENLRLQQSFEKQQKMLIEQLNREMVAAQLKLSNNLNNLSSKPTTSQHKKCDEQQNPLQSKVFILDHDTQKPTIDSFDLKQHKNQPNQHQPSPSSAINNNCSYNSVERNQLQSFNSQHSMYGLHYPQSPQYILPNNCHLSSTDHSNANTSLDISTLSTQTSPDILLATPATQNNNVHNGSGNKTPSSSRRRLFATEVNDLVTDPTAPNGSPYLACQRFVGKGEQLNPTNKNLIHLNNDNKRRLLADSTLILHAAASKINAYARGFLVRRLFQTEQIQRIVQTIRDTLIFVINLHIETLENPEEAHTPANIKLKAGLLQQLSSACRTLHLVFFETTIKERMEIIARDRKRIKTKLMTINRQRTRKITD